jgi:hypothetical protein
MCAMELPNRLSLGIARAEHGRPWVAGWCWISGPGTKTALLGPAVPKQCLRRKGLGPQSWAGLGPCVAERDGEPAVYIHVDTAQSLI